MILNIEVGLLDERPYPGPTEYDRGLLWSDPGSNPFQDLWDAYKEIGRNLYSSFEKIAADVSKAFLSTKDEYALTYELFEVPPYDPVKKPLIRDRDSHFPRHSRGPYEGRGFARNGSKLY